MCIAYPVLSYKSADVVLKVELTDDTLVTQNLTS